MQRPNENLQWQAQAIHGQNRAHDALPDDEEEQGPAHYFGPARYYCVETICAPCGVVKAWTKFDKSESPTKILDFIARVYPDPDSQPSYICIDKACQVLRTAVANGAWQEFFQISRIIVDSYHYINHRITDWLCRKWCNPGPLDGSAPNLVKLAYDKDGNPYLQRAFNTQACEQFNSWLGGYQSILKRMTPSNFNWLIHTMLVYHTKQVLKKQGLKAALVQLDEIDIGDEEEEEIGPVPHWINI